MTRKPRTAEAVTTLCEEFGKARVKVNTEYHLSVLTPARDAKHDLWLTKNGEVKYRLHGERRTELVRKLRPFIDAVHDADAGEVVTDLSAAREAFDLASLISESTRQLPPEVTEAVFVDAGWKAGVAQIGFVRLKRVEHGIDVSAASWPEKCSDCHQAEAVAIEAGASFAPHAVIYSDSQVLVEQLQPVYGDWLRWLPRKNNKAADKIANRRRT